MISKQTLIRDVSKITGYRQSDIREVIDAYIDTLIKYVEQGETIYISKLLKIEPKFYKSTKGYDLKTKSNVIIPDRYKIKAEINRGIKLQKNMISDL